jgi:hypothetical protein
VSLEDDRRPAAVGAPDVHLTVGRSRHHPRAIVTERTGQNRRAVAAVDDPRDGLRRHLNGGGRTSRRLRLVREPGEDQGADERVLGGAGGAHDLAQAGGAGGAAVRPRVDQRGQGHDRADRRPSGEEPAAHPPSPLRARLRARQERLLDGAQRSRVAPAPAHRLVERVAAPQKLPRLPPLLPQLGNGKQPVAKLPIDPVLVEPGLEHRPAGDQRLVRQLDPVALVDARCGDQTPGHHALEHPRRRRGIGETAEDLVAPGAPPRPIDGHQVA